MARPETLPLTGSRAASERATGNALLGVWRIPLPTWDREIAGR